MLEPIRYYFDRYGIDISDVKKIVCGQKYSSVLLKNGNIGVCANQKSPVHFEIKDFEKTDLTNLSHRIILNAYFNAKLNYLNDFPEERDIFENINFKSYAHIIMIGLFKPLLKKFRDSGIRIEVFDRHKKNRLLVSLKKEPEYIKNADAIILSATSITNNTFLEIVNLSDEHCDIFLLGPSSIMDSDMFAFRNIKKIFGAIFRTHDERVLHTIEQGHGTQTFLKYGRKVYLD